ncbi:MAG: D-alanine--D-alanine ligase [Verrucomicrobiota bacterium]
MTDKLHIAVLLGGPSAEREVSLRTGQAVANALRSIGHEVQEVDARPGQWSLESNTDVAFLALHGTYGEDGTVQAELEKLGVPYTGCGIEASRVAFDKVATKQKCISAGVPTPKGCLVKTLEAAWPQGWQPPVVVKPVRQGSSVGLSFVEEQTQWRAALARGFRYDSVLLVEERVIGRETTVGILDNQALPVVEVRPKTGGYDYANKYTPGATDYFCPAEFEAELTRRIQDAALGAFHAIGGRDYARVDVMVTGQGQPMVLEVNTLPGMTETSLLPKAAAAAGMDYPTLCQRMVELALHRSLAPAC